MKTAITNLNQVLTFQLEGMYEIIKDLQGAIPAALKNTTDPSTKELLHSYFENLTDQRMKLKRIFSYVLAGPYSRNSSTAANTILPFSEIAEKKALNSLRDILFVNAIHASIRFATTTYIDARYMAMRLEMDKVVALLDEILDIEESFLQRLRCHAAQLINNACLLAPVN